MRHRVFPLLGLWSLASVSHGAIIQFQTPACVTDDLLHEFGRYIIDEDNYGMMQLVENGDCVVLQYGDQVSVIKRGFVDSIVRYEGYKLYVPVEAVSE